VAPGLGAVDVTLHAEPGHSTRITASAAVMPNLFTVVTGADRRIVPAVDVAAVEDLLLRVGRLAEDLPEVAELDLNPVIARADGVLAGRRCQGAARPATAAPRPAAAPAAVRSHP
jgi:ATP-grasp domain